MGNFFRARSEAPSVKHITFHSNAINLQIAPRSTARSAPPATSVSVQAGSAIHQTAVEVLGSPRTQSYEGSMQSLGSSANSNRNVVGQVRLNESQHIDSQVISNFFSGISPQQQVRKQMRKTEYSEGKEEEEGLHMTN